MMMKKIKLIKYLPIIYACVLPGLGHIAIKQVKIGVMILIATLVLCVIPYIGFILIAGIYIWSIYDICKRIVPEVHERKNIVLNVFLLGFISLIVITAFFIASLIFVLDSSRGKASLKYVQREMSEIVNEVKEFERINKKLPNNIEELVESSPLKKKYATDYWGNKYKFSIEDREILVISPGKDKSINTEDDIIVRRGI